MKRPSWCSSVDWAQAFELKGRWFDSQSGAQVWVSAQVPGSGRTGDNHTLMFLSLSSYPTSPLSKNKEIRSLKLLKQWFSCRLLSSNSRYLNIENPEASKKCFCNMYFHLLTAILLPSPFLLFQKLFVGQLLLYWAVRNFEDVQTVVTINLPLLAI